MSDTTVTAPATPTAFAAAEPGLFVPNYPLPRLHLVSGSGARVRDTEGREYLDFVSGIAVNAFGHAPEGLAEVVAGQLATLGHVSNLYANTPGITLAERLLPATGYDRVFFCNSGTEGNEAALKFARARAGALGLKGRDLLAFHGGFHGRTGFALSTTYNPPYREPFQPLVPGVRFAPFNDLAALEAAFTDEVCGVIVEPVQGESGAVPATQEFLAAVRALATTRNAALILDEVQCGMGRSGTVLAQQQYGIRGDMTVMSKALGAGLPIGAVLMTEAVAATIAPGMHGCTFGGNPVSCSAALWALGRVTAPGFLARVQQAAATLADGLAAIATRHAAVVHEVRGMGLLRAIDLRADAPFGPAALGTAAREEGLLLVRGGDRALRLLPPLTVTDDEIHEALARLDAALTRLSLTEGAAS